jgi:exonuclease SbcC
MKVKALKFGGIGRFRDNVEVPIAELGGAELVAVCGGNGAGKSTMLEMIPGSLYRMTPSRGALAAMANRKDSYTELTLEVAGETYTLKVMIDGVARSPKTEAYVFDADGQPLTSGKSKEFDAEVARKFTSREVFFSSAFAAQTKEGNFLSLPASRRKSLFADLLGLGRLQELSDAAGERSRSSESELARLRGRAEGYEAKAKGLPALRDELRFSTAALEEAESKGKVARDERAAYDATLAAWSQTRDELSGAHQEAVLRLRDAEGLQQTYLDELKRIDERVASLAGEKMALSARLKNRSQLETMAEEASDAANDIKELEQVEAAWQEYDKRFLEWERDHDRLAAALVAAQAKEAQAKRDLERVRREASSLAEVPCGGDGQFAGCELIRNVVEARTKVPEFEALLEQATLAERVADKNLQGIGSGPSCPNLDESLAGVRVRLMTLRGIVEQASRAKEKLAGLREVADRLTAVEAQIGELGDAKEVAVTSLACATEEVEQKKSTFHATRVECERHEAARPAPPQHDLDALREAWSESSKRVERLTAVVEDAEAESEKLKEAEHDIKALIAEVDQWKHLQKALGRDGVQALEIDAAGPEVSDLTNELLHACYGSRFTVSLETTQLKADGKGTKEVFDLRVLDSERGTEGSADQLSGGEKVLVSEALALAIAIYNARRSSVPLEDLFRDECAGALSSSNAVRYIEMLRKALDLGGFHRCYFVAHQSELWPLADSILEVKDGTVAIADAPDVVVAAPEANESEAA